MTRISINKCVKNNNVLATIWCLLRKVSKYLESTCMCRLTENAGQYSIEDIHVKIGREKTKRAFVQEVDAGDQIYLNYPPCLNQTVELYQELFVSLTL